MTERPTTVVKNHCRWCNRPSEVTVFTDELEAYLHDRQTGGPKRHAQVAFPEMPPDQREILISGTHPACWDAMWPDEEDTQE